MLSGAAQVPLQLADLLQLLGGGTSVPPPPQFSFQACDWPEWILRFEQYRSTSNTRLLTSKAQIDHLLYIMGGKSNDILASFRLSEEEQTNYELVKQRFNNHFVARKTKLYERMRFNTRTQQQGESIDQFITDLHTIGKKCEYGPLLEEFVRDRIIAGMLNRNLSTQLQNLESEPTLEQVVSRVRHSEHVSVNQHLLQRTDGSEQPTNLHAVHRSAKPKRKQHIKHQSADDSTKASSSQQSQGAEPSAKGCGWCGSSKRHSREECRAVKDACNYCKTPGHWEKVCRKKKRHGQEGHRTGDSTPRRQHIHNVDEEELPKQVGELFLGSLGVAATKAAIQRVPPWMVTLQLNGRPVSCKIDTGADATVIGRNVFEALRESLPQLQKVDQTLYGPNHSSLPMDGVLKQVELRWNERSVKTDIYVIPGNVTPLLGRPEAATLELVRRQDPEQVAAVSSTAKPEDEFPDIFKGIGKMPGAYHIRLKPGVKPLCVYTPRHTAIPLREPLERKLAEMEETDIIEPVTHPTEWCSQMVPVVKKRADGANDGISIRLTVDYVVLNEGIEREVFQLPTAEEGFAEITGCEVFSKLDATDSYFQVELDEKSRDLTTFLTHKGRYRFKRLPMGLKSASEVFQRKISTILAGIPGVVNLMDDILVGGRTLEEHDRRLRLVLHRLKENNMTLNPAKCIFRVSECTMLGHRITRNGISPMEEKTKAIVDMPVPKDITALRSFLGSVNYLMKFLPNLADVNRPLRELLHKDSVREWGPEHTRAFEDIKQMICNAPILSWYDPKRPTRVTSDASMYGAGAVLEQQAADGEWKPVQFMSASFTPTQQRYSMIEKEACAVLMACEKFQLYLIGLPQFVIRTDHKPLKQILETKPIAELTVRLQRMRMRMIPFWYTIEHIPGKVNYLADMLSRSPLPTQQRDVDIADEEVDDRVHIAAVVATLPASTPFLKRIAEDQEKDRVTNTLKRYVLQGWPTYRRTDPDLQPYHEHQVDIALVGDIVTYQQRIIVPKSLQPEILNRIHEGHLPLYKCIARAKSAVWWPGIKGHIAELIQRCNVCVENTVNRPEPLVPSKVPEFPWDLVAIDIGTLEGQDYLSIIDDTQSFRSFTS